MEKRVRKYSLSDPAQEVDDREFWNTQSYEYKILVLENLRRVWSNMNTPGSEHGYLEGFRRVLRIAKQA